MRTYIVIVASALLLAALVTTISARLFSGDNFALLLLTFLALVVNGLINVRLTIQSAPSAQRAAKARLPTRPPRKRRGGRPQPRGDGKFEEGEIKWFDDAKGFGFVIRASGEEIFVSKRSVRAKGGGRPQLRSGSKVSFQVGENEKGRYAKNVAAL